MRSLVAPWLAVAALMLMNPLVGASGTLEAGPLVVRIDNSHETDCVEDVTGLCAAEARGEAGTTEIDGRQEIAFAGVGLKETHRREVNEAAGYPLLPGGDLVYIDASTFVIHHPLFPFLVDNVGTKEGPERVVVVYFTEENWGWEYFGPGIAPMNTTLAPRRATREYTDSGTDYDGFKGFHEILVEADTDTLTREWATFACWELNDSSCASQQEGVAASGAELTPNASWSLIFYETQVVGSSDNLGPHNKSSSLPDDTRTERIANRTSPQGPEGTPDERPPVAGELDPVVSTVGPGMRPGPSHVPEPDPVPLHVAAGEPQTIPPRPYPPVAAYAASFLVAVLLAAFYSRIKRHDEALLSARRVRILAILGEQGPRQVADLARQMALDWSTIEHHLTLLRRTGHVTLQRRQRRTVVALPGQSLRAVAMPRPAWEAILEIVAANGGMILRGEVHKRASTIPLRTRNHALRQLEARGLLYEEGTPMGPRLRLTTRAA